MEKTRRIGVVIVCLALVAAGCAGESWRQVRKKDSLVDYRRYVNQNPDSKHVAKAEEHVAFLELRREPTLGGYLQFRARYPESKLAKELRAQFEPKIFDRARFAGTSAAYSEFMTLFPDGPLAERALGNQAFLEAGGFTTGVLGLGDFANAHPRSDYAGDARRSADSISLRDREKFHRVGLVVKISPEVPDSPRLVEEFSRRAIRQYAGAGYELIAVHAPESGDQNPKARLVIEHQEVDGRARATGGGPPQTGMVATTRISLYSETGADPIWQEKFELRLSAQERFSETSMLFNPNARDYWASFYVPVASWPNRAALRNPIPAEKKIVAVDSVGDRAIVLYGDGGFKLLELSNSEAPLALVKFQHPKDFTRWQGVKIEGQHIILYGSDGLEVLAFGKSGPVVVGSQERQNVGTVRAVVPFGEDLILATSRGLLMTDAEAGQLRRLSRRAIQGVAKVGDLVVFCDEESLYISTLELLAKQRLFRKLKLGFEFGPKRVIAFGQSALVLGDMGAIILDLEDPKQPKVVSSFKQRDIGHIQDAAVVAGRVFFIGERGLQLLDSDNARVSESVDILPRSRVSRMGRFLVAVGDQGLQVVDTAPLTGTMERDLNAAPAP